MSKLVAAREGENLASDEPSFPRASDSPFVVALKNGEEWAFDQLVRREQDRIYSLCFQFLGNGEDARDAAQEAFIQVVRNIGGFRGESSLTTWLYRIAINVCKNQVRSRSRRGMDTAESLDDTTQNSQGWRRKKLRSRRPGPDTLAFENELEEALTSSLTDLPEHYRDVFILRHQEGLTYEEIAQTLEIPTGTVRSRLSEARRMLRETLGPLLRQEAVIRKNNKGK